MVVVLLHGCESESRSMGNLCSLLIRLFSFKRKCGSNAMQLMLTQLDDSTTYSA